MVRMRLAVLLLFLISVVGQAVAWARIRPLRRYKGPNAQGRTRNFEHLSADLYLPEAAGPLVWLRVTTIGTAVLFIPACLATFGW